MQLYLKENSIWKSFEIANPQNAPELKERNISIANSVSIGECARIGNGVSIGEGVSIGKDASIGEGARIEKGINLSHTCFIIGSKHSVTYCGNGRISIGCHNNTVEDWLEMYQNVGTEENYSADEQAEYYRYICLIRDLYCAEPVAVIG